MPYLPCIAEGTSYKILASMNMEGKISIKKDHINDIQVSPEAFLDTKEAINWIFEDKQMHISFDGSLSQPIIGTMILYSDVNGLPFACA